MRVYHIYLNDCISYRVNKCIYFIHLTGLCGRVQSSEVQRIQLKAFVADSCRPITLFVAVLRNQRGSGGFRWRNEQMGLGGSCHVRDSSLVLALDSTMVL